MKNILIFSFLLVVFGLNAQTTTKNYVKETTRRSASAGQPIFFGTTNTHIVNTTYYDGLGRPIQIIDQNSSPDDNKNIVTHIEYEKNIGQTKEYLPFLITGYTTSGGIRPLTTYKSDFVEESKNQTLTFYNTEKYEYTPNPYNENRKEASPRQRTIETGFPGYTWSLSEDHYGTENYRNTIRSSYALNTSNEVKRYNVTTSYSDGTYKNSVSENGYYPDNTLTKTVVKNENWKDGDGSNNTVEEFKDAKGNVVLKRTFNNNDAHDTYYVYNDLNLLAFVIPPMANGSVLGDYLDKWCYQYHYDAKKRLVEKKLPQKEWEYIVYDKVDRVVMTGPVYNPFGDGSKGWLITKYDAFGRSVYTGYYDYNNFSSATRNSLAQNNFVVETKTSANTIDGITVNYSNNSFPTNFKLLSVNYYDNYTYPNAPTSFPTIETQTVNTAVKGQLTGSWTRVLTTSTSTAGTLSYNLYDDKYRAIRSYSSNHLGGYTQVDSRLTFTGVPTKTITTQKQNTSATVLTITDNFTYDRRDRLLTQNQQIGAGTVETIVSNSYDPLGALINKNVGGAAGNLQKVDYKYNIRGWLTDINNAEYYHNDTENDLFQFKINYDEGYGTPLYNGNISSVFSRTKVDNIFRGYSYNYDNLNRLMLAKNLFYRNSGWIMGVKEDDFYDEDVNYDMNGNILTLNRTSKINDQKVAIDELTYNYNGNQLQAVNDATNHPEGFKKGNFSGNDYEYDSFGNITKDLNKQISSVTYNHLNLPYQVSFSNGGIINYTYDAAGTRLSKKVTPSGGLAVTTDYLSGFQYENGELQFFPHAEGYVKHKGNNQFMYAYQYKDHLGNVRLSYADCDGDGVINPATEILEENNYYPFGLKHKGYNEIANSNRSEAAEKYKYNKKEWQDELGLNWYNYGWRNYDPAISRWLNPDPLIKDLDFNFNPNEIDKNDDDEIVSAIEIGLGNGGGIYNTDNLNPYSYGYNNPISFDDPDGRCPTCVIGAIVGAATDYGMQVAANYMDPSVKNKWTDNISVSSIALSAAEGALTQGASAGRKFVVKGAAMVANNVVDYNTSKGVKVETSVRNIAKNTALDVTVKSATKGVGNLAKTSKLDKLANKAEIKSNNKAKDFVQKSTGLNSKTSSNLSKTLDVKGVSKQLSSGIKNSTNTAVENSAKVILSKPVDELKTKTNN